MTADIRIYLWQGGHLIADIYIFSQITQKLGTDLDAIFRTKEHIHFGSGFWILDQLQLFSSCACQCAVLSFELYFKHHNRISQLWF